MEIVGCIVTVDHWVAHPWRSLGGLFFKYPRTQSHSVWHIVQQCLQNSQVICRRGVPSHRVRRHCDSTNKPPRRFDHSTKGQSILEHNLTACGTSSSSASRTVKSSVGTEYADIVTARTSRRDASTTVQRGKRSTAASVPRRRAPRHSVRQQHYLSSAPGCRIPSERTSCYVMPSSFQEATHASSVVVIHAQIVGVFSSFGVR